ncbi:MAG: family 20 glycosylhydrolase [Alistipes sp.]
MKHFALLLLIASLGDLWSACAQPSPRHQTAVAGSCTLTSTTMLSYQTSLAPLADYLCDYLPLTTASDKLSSNEAIVLATDPTLADEGYRLTVGTHRIEITGGSSGGVFNGIQMLFRLLPAEIYAKQCALPVTLACTTIEDAPRFSYRGMMLDVARTWIDFPHVLRYIDLLSYHGMNKLHLHLSDDEGWRIEIKSHPELTEIGGFRGGDSPIRPVYGKWDEKYGGYFTQAQMRELITYAQLRNIEIIPEIDLPGHSRNIAAVHPEILCNFPPDTLSTNGYDYRSAWCVAREDNYMLLNDILSEICALFPSEYIHVGGDEVEVSQWESCPDCQALMKQRKMTSSNQLEDLFMSRMAEILQANGKRPAVWNEAVQSGTLTRESRVYGWKNSKACLDAITKGYRTIVMPSQYFYLDMRQTPQEDGHDWAAVTDVRKLYGFDFAAQGFGEEQLREVEGIEGAFWSEVYVSHEPEKPDYLDFMCFPRICALSRLAWCGNAESWTSYYKTLITKHYDRMAAMGIRFRLTPPKVNYAQGILTAATDDGSEIYYLKDTLSEPYRYLRSIRTDRPHRYKFCSRYKSGRSAYVAEKSYYQTITPLLKLTTSMGESARLPYTNAATYKGVSRTRRACRQGDWIRYTFAEPVRCREMYLQTGHRQFPKTILTTGYAEISYDGQNFERVADLEQGSITLRPARPVRAVRLVSTCDDNGTPYVTIQPPKIKPNL